MLLRKFRPHPKCLRDMKPVTATQTAKCRDDMVYTFNGGEFHFYKVDDVDEDGNVFACTEFHVMRKTFQRHPQLDFACIGVYKCLGLKTTRRELTWQEIKGKAYLYKGLIMSISKNVLTEI